MTKRYKVEMVVYQTVIVEAESEEAAKEEAYETPDSDREFESEEVQEVYLCDEDGNMIDEDEGDDD